MRWVSHKPHQIIEQLIVLTRHYILYQRESWKISPTWWSYQHTSIIFLTFDHCSVYTLTLSAVSPADSSGRVWNDPIVQHTMPLHRGSERSNLSSLSYNIAQLCAILHDKMLKSVQLLNLLYTCQKCAWWAVVFIKQEAPLCNKINKIIQLAQTSFDSNYVCCTPCR